MHSMPELELYVLTEKLGESLQTQVYKGYRKKAPEQPLLLKPIKLLSGWDDQLRHLRQKIGRLRVLHDPRVCTPLALESDGAVQFIVQPWFSGQLLDDWAAQQKTLELKDFFSIACTLADILKVVHDAGITHGGIKPHNILVQSDTLTVRLTDFITPLDIRDVSHFIYDPGFVRDTLAYTSPEQTGRINCRVDFSTDLYSLGIVLYELLTKSLPFFSLDPLELIHSHLAEEAPQAFDVNPNIPSQLGEIIAKLILKQPEKRYQSAEGLLIDLNRCRDEYATSGAVSNFTVGLQDHTKRIIFISKMVGRSAESEIIQREYDEVISGKFRSVFISGLSGIGKTRLIQELQKPLVLNRGYFTSGKFDQYQKNIPYSSLIQALRNLMRIFLTESDTQVAQWKIKILNAVGNNGRVITDVLPELEFIIGTQPEVPPLPPVEARNRFNNMFGHFITCLAGIDNPLVLFIDDLQWCDSATFDFLQNIFINHKDHPYLFFIGAYRHNEVGAEHPLTILIRNIQEFSIEKNSASLQEMQLGALNEVDCHEMVAYILDSSLDATIYLANFITLLTEGNPLFVSESLAWLYNEGLLHTDVRHHWEWDMSRIRDTQMPATVVELFSSKVRKLPPETLHILNLCACMGNRFTAEDLALVLDINFEQLFEGLKLVLSLGMLLENKADLQFVHDRVQEAVLRLVDESLLPSIHWRIGNRLLIAAPKSVDIEDLDNLFTIAAHLNKGRPTSLDEADTYHLVDLNFHAGNKALSSLAGDAANDFYRIAHAYLPSDSWTVAYELTFRIYQRLAKTDLMCGRYEASDVLLNQLIEHAVSDLDKAEALAEQTTSLSSYGSFIKAIETANRGLAYFDKAIPKGATEAKQSLQTLMAKIGGQTDVWRKILHMPFTKERKNKIELAFYSELIPDLYMSGLVPQLYLSAAQSTLHCLQGGMDESVIYSLTIMGLNLGEQEQFEQAFLYQDLAHDLCAKHPNTFGATRGINGIVWCNMHSRSHPSEIVDYSLKGIQSGKRCGDLYNAGLSYGPLMWNLAVQGKNLRLVEEYAEECLSFSKKNQLSFSVGLAEAVLAGWVAPMKANFKPIDMEKTLVRWSANNYVAASGSYFAMLGFAQYYMGNYTAAHASLEAVEIYLQGLTDNVLKRLWFVFRILNRLRISDGIAWFEIEIEITPLLQKIEVWAQLGPLLRPYLAFIYAEISRVKGEYREARVQYLDAIAEAQVHDYGLLSGHLHECLGELMIHAGLGNARMYYAEARRLYRVCHADSKVSLLQERHAYVSVHHAQRISADFTVANPETSELATLPNLDINYLMKSALTLSAEIELPQLLQKIMSVMLESSGAQHGYLLIKQADTLVIKAEEHVGKKHINDKPHYLWVEAQDICQDIVRYVLNTKQKVVLRDALTEGDFQNATEVKNLSLHSVMCLPVIKQSQMIGVLYLENRLSDGIFTSDKIVMTELLTSHAAISLDNSNLMEETRIAATAFESQEGILVTDLNNVILRVNRGFSDISGFTAEDAIGKKPSLLGSGKHDAAFYASMWKSINDSGIWRGEVLNRRKNGEIYPAHLAITAVKGPKDVVINYVGTFTDITLSKAAAKEIHQLAFYDALTQLPNRRLLLDRLKLALASSERNNLQGALLFLDLDHFKTLNDTLGHDVGDVLLQQVADRLSTCVRECDTVARLGGDEYVVMLEGLSVNDIEAAAQTDIVCEKILMTLNKPYQLVMHEYNITPSIGITLFNGHKSDLDELLKQADIAMYQAKKAGRNTLRFFDPQMQESINSRAILEIELRKALNNQQFQLYYQVQVDDLGHPFGAEALIRWVHPERGLVSPYDFISLAEETGLILPIGQWVLETACAQIKAWEQSELTRHLTLSINVSAKQFRQFDFTAKVNEALQRNAINPMQLKLELTESILLEHIEDTIDTMNSLKEAGVRFSLDDFGTGYSSLQYLKRLPLSQLKIDQSFVNNIAIDGSDQAIVKTIIAMANVLNFNVIAEGVEIECQRQLLVTNGCKAFQGYLFGKPMPIDQFEANIRRI